MSNTDFFIVDEKTLLAVSGFNTYIIDGLYNFLITYRTPGHVFRWSKIARTNTIFLA